MAFWQTFGEFLQSVYAGMQTPITLGSITFTLADLMIWGGVCACVSRIVWGIIDDDVY